MWHIGNMFPTIGLLVIFSVYGLSHVSRSSLIPSILHVPGHHHESGFHLRQRNNGSSRNKHLLLSCVHSRHVTKKKIKKSDLQIAVHRLKSGAHKTHSHAARSHKQPTQSDTIALAHVHTGNKLSHYALGYCCN